MWLRLAQRHRTLASSDGANLQSLFLFGALSAQRDSHQHYRPSVTTATQLPVQLFHPVFNIDVNTVAVLVLLSCSHQLLSYDPLPVASMSTYCLEGAEFRFHLVYLRSHLQTTVCIVFF